MGQGRETVGEVVQSFFSPLGCHVCDDEDGHVNIDRAKILCKEFTILTCNVNDLQNIIHGKVHVDSFKFKSHVDEDVLAGKGNPVLWIGF